MRGAPAIGVVAAYGLALAVERGDDPDAAYETLAGARPTAVNLRWALDEMRHDPTRERARRSTRTRSSAAGAMGAHAVPLFPTGARVLTHCNAGGLATGGYGSAVGAIRAAWERGRRRARLGRRDAAAAAGRAADGLGARALGIPHAVIVDGAAASRMAAGRGRPRDHGRRPDRRERRHGEQDRHLRARGARRAPRDPVRDRRARHRRSTRRRRPAPTIPIEERDGAEVTTRFAARNPAFDVTPAELITAIVTEDGVHRAPYPATLPGLG